MQPSPEDLRKFMDAIGKVESGGTDDPYRARGPAYHQKYGRAQGRYQIMSKIWPSWAAEAGYSGLTEQQFLNNPQIQDAIAAKKMSQYYDRYDGNWQLVAAAWFSGVGGADKMRDRGIQSMADVDDGFTSVPDYVNKVMGAYGQQGMTSGAAQNLGKANPSVTPSQVQDMTQSQVDQQASRSPQRNMTQSVMNRLSDMIQRNPNNPEMHATVRKAMQNFMGADTGPGGTAGAAGEVKAAAERKPMPSTQSGPEPEWHSGPPTQTGGGPGQSGVR